MNKRGEITLTIRVNAGIIKESAKSGSKVFVCVARLRRSCLNEPYQIYGYKPLTFLLYYKQINILSRNICVLYINVRILYVDYIPTLEVRMSNNSIHLVIH
jgi:hypothetical protein